MLPKAGVNSRSSRGGVNWENAVEEGFFSGFQQQSKMQRFLCLKLLLQHRHGTPGNGGSWVAQNLAKTSVKRQQEY